MLILVAGIPAAAGPFSLRKTYRTNVEACRSTYQLAERASNSNKTCFVCLGDQCPLPDRPFPPEDIRWRKIAAFLLA
jgi:hypothetical protein